MQLRPFLTYHQTALRFTLWDLLVFFWWGRARSKKRGWVSPFRLLWSQNLLSSVVLSWIRKERVGRSDWSPMHRDCWFILRWRRHCSFRRWFSLPKGSLTMMRRFLCWWVWRFRSLVGSLCSPQTRWSLLWWLGRLQISRLFCLRWTMSLNCY